MSTKEQFFSQINFFIVLKTILVKTQHSFYSFQQKDYKFHIKSVFYLLGLTPDRLGLPSHDTSPVSPEATTPGAQSPSHLHYSQAQHRRFSMEVRSTSQKQSKSCYDRQIQSQVKWASSQEIDVQKSIVLVVVYVQLCTTYCTFRVRREDL